MRRPLYVVPVSAVLAMALLGFLRGSVAAGAGNAANGKALYAKVKCEICHGKEGKGDGPAAKSLKPPPTNFSDVKLMCKMSDKQLSNVIKNGGPAEKKAATMPSYKSKLKDSEINDIVAYLRTLAK